LATKQNQFTKIYDLDYFTGSTMFLYIGDVWVDEVTSLQYTCQQQKTPLYGYASQLFDDTSAGHVLVQGAFSVNFKEQGYLWAVLRRYFSMNAADAGVRPAKNDSSLMHKPSKDGTNLMPRMLDENGVRVGSHGNSISRATIERLTQGDATRGEKYKFYHELASYSTFSVKNPKDKKFEDIVEAFEDEVWNPNTANSKLNNQIRRTDRNEFDGFDMYVVFGNYANAQANHTVRKIIGVRLTGESKQVIIDGSVVQEQYSFVAQSVV